MKKNNEVETNVPLLGLLWNRKDDSISFNGTFSMSKKIGWVKIKVQTSAKLIKNVLEI